MGIEQSAQSIADALAPSVQSPAVKWRWGTVEAVGEQGTMDVSVGGSTLYGIRASRHCMSAKVGDRVRVSYYGTEALVDAIRATESEQPYLQFREVASESQSIASGAIGDYDIEAPLIDGYTLRGAIQTWPTGSGSVILSASYRSSTDNHMHVRARANVASNAAVHMLLMYVRD